MSTPSERSHDALVYDATDAAGSWEPSTLAPGQRLTWSQPLYKQLDVTIEEGDWRKPVANTL